jgi:23S rRNA G2445 N2-methylase RlmL
MIMDTVELVNLAIAGDKDALEAAFNNAMAAKVSDALEIKKVEIASNLLGTEEADETTEVEVQADGTDGDAIQSEPAAEGPAETEQN